MKDERLYLVHIIESIERVEEYTRDGKETFLASSLIQDAALRNLQVVAESTQRLADVTKDDHAEIPWQDIAGFRNKVTHDYFDINLDIVWNVIEEYLPPLKRCVTAILAERYGTDAPA